jgi:hypothetical protein
MMATKKKAKKVSAAKKTNKIVMQPKQAPELHMMSQDVKDWIARASSIMAHLKGENERLKQENSDMKAYKKWAEHRILRSEGE